MGAYVLPNLRRLVRIPVLFLHVMLGVVVILACVAIDRLLQKPLHGGLGRRAQAFWCHSICRLLGVRIRHAGERIADPPVLLAANHVSWLDILVISADHPVSFLSKEEVRRWPGIGFVATCLGTLYVQRGNPRAAPKVVADMVERLHLPDRVAFFPEGTTTRGMDLLPLKHRLFQAAVDAKVPVQPLLLRYLNPDGSVNCRTPFVDNQNLIAQVIRLAGEPRVEARLIAGDTLSSIGHDRASLRDVVERHMRDMLLSQNGHKVAIE
ncbi:1-acyl-sn-glycerol-3-phosphate acyltransferase [Methylonatrum kenyense]|uniref:lysophospholipid acyltransferase family protein n=1 Tax=Methylonatrum kenyense TaxID=455253 RepID=UPI0020BDF73A|nr:lysophospholipid acyltransferase family protein [Methylonatrum kenyense]MCK8517096.1 1-acyl-sn-glycerol-3-phosphate acyltransferase [Methylonatrum kenyense]